MIGPQIGSLSDNDNGIIAWAYCPLWPKLGWATLWRTQPIPNIILTWFFMLDLNEGPTTLVLYNGLCWDESLTQFEKCNTSKTETLNYEVLQCLFSSRPKIKKYHKFDFLVSHNPSSGFSLPMVNKEFT